MKCFTKRYFIINERGRKSKEMREKKRKEKKRGHHSYTLGLKVLAFSIKKD